MLPSFSPLCTLWSNRFLYPLSYNIYLPSHRAERTSLFISGCSMKFIEYDLFLFLSCFTIIKCRPAITLVCILFTPNQSLPPYDQQRARSSWQSDRLLMM